jgi:hypothetical protein
MPRFFFHIVTPEEKFPDDAGAELPDAHAAHQRALRLIGRVMLCTELQNEAVSERWSRWVVHIADAHGRNVLSVLFPRGRTQAIRRACAMPRKTTVAS